MLYCEQASCKVEVKSVLLVYCINVTVETESRNTATCAAHSPNELRISAEFETMSPKICCTDRTSIPVLRQYSCYFYNRTLINSTVQ